MPESVFKPHVEEISLPPSVMLAALPILGYATAFSYELGKCKYFGLPPELIRLDLTTGFIVALGLGSAAAALPFLASFLSIETVGFDFFVRVRGSIIVAAFFVTVVGVIFTPFCFRCCSYAGICIYNANPLGYSK
jgi:hypothetical protein